MDNVVGMGVPSKYLALPVASFGRAETVTLNRARRDRPHRTKNVRNKLSRGVRSPRVNAVEAGASPNEIFILNRLMSAGKISDGIGVGGGSGWEMR